MKKGARLLRVIRAEQDVTQTKVARRAGLSASRYWQIENGEGSEPSVTEKNAVAAVLNVKVSEVAWPSMTEAHA